MARNNFDIILIVIGLFGGAILTNFAIALLPGASIELRLSLSVVGALIGFAVGLAMSFAIGTATKQAEVARYERMKANLPPVAPSQIVGKKCVTCEQGIIFAPEGSFCPSCFEPYCNRCKPINSKCHNCAVGGSRENELNSPSEY